MTPVLRLRSLLIPPNPPKANLHKATKRATMATSALSSPMPLRGESGTKTPRLVYGTAWKKDKTADLVYQALKAGFRGVDTAAQPRHYQEGLVGDGIRRAIRDGIVDRKDLFVCPSFYFCDPRFPKYPTVTHMKCSTNSTPIS
jgi:hypothetical protein